jgi:hypothetical protein
VTLPRMRKLSISYIICLKYMEITFRLALVKHIHVCIAQCMLQCRIIIQNLNKK